ncbi:MAG: Lrp/AsnC family transcriptional regulator, leucine-responsive regulatory protein [Solirubrobacteraceae bacterium]|jgi:Lrp/AsnC family leucine-responsive transcriptional regulator|nr:Lrp/AsnC family transcriptional regulator, leucine-responsive regulatory protein [Solirubrobacteraceae bacterium]
MRLHVRAMDDLEGVLDRFTPFGQTTTSIVHSAPVPRRPLPLEPPA